MTQSLLEEQFESIIKCTKHGIQRLIERGFTPDEVLSLITKPDFVRMQKDGAKAFIKQIGEKYSVIIINEATGEVVTGLKGTTVKKIIALGKNYGWTL